jgi:hypothetical protein
MRVPVTFSSTNVSKVFGWYGSSGFGFGSGYSDKKFTVPKVTHRSPTRSSRFPRLRIVPRSDFRTWSREERGGYDRIHMEHYEKRDTRSRGITVQTTIDMV